MGAMALVIPDRLSARCQQTRESTDWLARLPAAIGELRERWSLTIGAPFDSDEVSCAWVAPATLADGTQAVLKVAMPHFEAEHEISGLRFCDGDPTIRLIDADESLGAMLLERCEPGTHLRVLRQELEQDVVIAALLRRLWRSPRAPHPFRPLSALTACWGEETLRSSAQWPDAGLVREGLSLFSELPRTAKESVLLATDLHAGNVLQAQREPWLVIDPKPFVGDPEFDATQHLLNSVGRLRAEPLSTIRRFAELLRVDSERVRLWMFARLAAEPRDDWRVNELTELAHTLAL
jgi:streptomycin 6-kinase